MKKIWILLILPFFLTGCYDYQELNNRAVIAGIAIDYKEEEFFIDLEILNNVQAKKKMKIKLIMLKDTEKLFQKHLPMLI